MPLSAHEHPQSMPSKQPYSKSLGYKTFLPDPAEEPVRQLPIWLRRIPGNLHCKRLACKSRFCCKQFCSLFQRRKKLNTSAKSVWFPHESGRGPTQETWISFESWSSASRINEWSLKEKWENDFCEQKNKTLQSQLPTEPTQRQWIEWTKFLTAKRSSNKAAYAVFLSFQNLTTSILCSKMRPTGDPPGPIILLWVWVVLCLQLKSLTQNLQKMATQHGTQQHVQSASSQNISGHRSKIYMCAQVVYISQMAILKKSTQAANICKPSLLPVTFLLPVPFGDVRKMHKDPQMTMK